MELTTGRPQQGRLPGPWGILLRLLGTPEQKANSPNCHLFPTRKAYPKSYLRLMRMAYELCLATAAKQVPSGPDWIHEVKHDGYRMLVIRENERVRLFSRNGTDWTKRYPWIAEAALKNREKQFVIDGEAVILGVDGISDFNALHSRRHDEEVQLYAFDVLALGGDDLRPLPLSVRKTNLARLLRGRPTGFSSPRSRPER
ncbi:ATP-dependent DNA ligase [Bradyrhizobium ottawaense]|uniref:ATP-dependent DNA ligase n=1 Tax=Bradyrhizobium ottawaense TaxID=931866 RepID=UPI003518F8D4